MRTVGLIVLLWASCEATVHTRGAKHQGKIKMHKQVAKEEPAAAEGTAKAPEQGFDGEDVQHVDMDTATGDWRREYGPKGPPHHPAADMKSGAVGFSLLGFLSVLGVAAVF